MLTIFFDDDGDGDYVDDEDDDDDDYDGDYDDAGTNSLKEYNPSLTDDADAARDETAGSLHFLARTCVGENVGDTCSTGNKSSTGKIVTVCR